MRHSVNGINFISSQKRAVFWLKMAVSLRLLASSHKSAVMINSSINVLDIDGRHSLSSFQSAVAREEIAAIDSDFIEAEASVLDGMR